ncbi:hypothetical protein [Actinacidiphila acidipaludis]|uniref:Lipoprotein n=1 Tax=Actinacidiphila acidipaludis TaxID=2873382 RepID=A0ABS7QF12_9ACTN|nr:hypothetical protein [Streptomyces acidipaludis]MBY8881754.1 hypothetical protein [Streptomyces acidipaludis]
MTWNPTRPSAARRAGVSVAALAASGALLLTACSSSSSGTSADAKPSGSASGSPAASGNNGTQAMEAYRQCLQQHGVNLPTFQRRSPGAGRPSGAPSGRPGGAGGRGYGGFPGFGGASPDAATQKALDACKSLRPQFNGQGRGGNGNSSAFQAFASCLKDHGVALATPSPGATNRGGGFGALRGLNTSDPKTAKAYDTCKALLPQRPSGAPTTSPSATV